MKAQLQHTSGSTALARALAGQRPKVPPPPSVTPRITTGIVASVGTDGTATVQIDGSSVASTGYTLTTAPISIGDVVTVVVSGSQVFVLGTLGSPPAASGVAVTTGTVTAWTATTATVDIDGTETTATFLTGSMAGLGESSFTGSIVLVATDGTTWWVLGTVGIPAQNPSGRIICSEVPLTIPGDGDEHSIPTEENFLLGGMTEGPSGGLVIGTAGVYRVSAQAGFTDTVGAVGNAYVCVYQNGARLPGIMGRGSNPSGAGTIYTGSDLVSCAVDDNLQLYFCQNSGSAQALSSDLCVLTASLDTAT